MGTNNNNKKSYTFFSRIAAGLITVALAGNVVACGDIVLKVNKKGNSANTASSGQVSLVASEDFLKHLDNLKVIASDMLIKELASKDYVGNFRKSFRKYRQFIIERGENYQLRGDGFYNGSSECRDLGLSLNMNEMDETLGMLLKTAVLAKVSEVSAAKMNPAISKELSAISQLILRELGLEVAGQSTVDKTDEATITTGQVVMRLKEIPDEKIDGEAISADMKVRDAAETVTLQFTRSLGAGSVGHFDARITAKQLVDTVSGQTKDVIGTVTVDRFKEESKFIHTVFMTVAKAGLSPHFSRMLSFREAGGSRGRIEMVDTLNAGLDGQVSYATVLDAEKGSQCKLSGSEASDVIEDISNPLDKDPASPSDKEIVPIDDKVGSPEPTPVPTTTTTPSKPVVSQTPVQKVSQTPVQK
ncbi:MAG: hypothetical protein RIQ81_1369 [Pseudomonadota bacterium]